MHLRGGTYAFTHTTGSCASPTAVVDAVTIWIPGSNNVFEQLDTHHHMGPGLSISGGAGDLVLNSDSHDNHDLRSSNGAGENADGFGARSTPAGRRTCSAAAAPGGTPTTGSTSSPPTPP